VIRIAKMGEWSVQYYESTAVRGNEYGGGLSEYYSERDTREPIVLVAGDREFAAEAMGVTHRGGISQEHVTRWFSEGISPAGPGVGKPRPGTCGWDVLVAVPKSVSLTSALAKDPVVGTIVTTAIREATEDALLGYMYKHAGYTRVSNPQDKSKKDMQRLPALPFIAYFHHTARPLSDGTCDPHMHVHCLLPGKVARADGRMVTIDSESMYHEAKAAGMIFQKSLRDRLSAALGIEWDEVDPHTGIAEIKGFSRAVITEWSRRQTALMEWAQENLGEYSRRMADAEHSDAADQEKRGWAKGEREWLDTAQRATRQKKLESLHYDELRERWQQDPRAASLSVEDFLGVVAAAAAKEGPGERPTAAQVFELLGTVKNAWTRADVVEAVAGLWGPGRGVEVIPVDEIEAAVDGILEEGCFQIVEDRQSWHREGHLRYTDMITLQREAEILELCKATSREFTVNVRQEWFAAKGLKFGAEKAMTELAVSSHFINVLEAPAGTGKTTSLKAFKERAESQGKRIVVMSAARKALTEAHEKEAGHEFYTIAAVRNRIAKDRIDWDHKTVVVVDEAATAGDRDLYEIIKQAAATHSKVILIGDSHQLQPVQAGGGMFRDLSENLPWTQGFTHVWRQVDPEEKAMTLALRDAKTESQIRKVAHWYATHDRLRAGDELSMADQLVRDYFDAVADGQDVMAIADQWERADSLNLRIQRINNIALENQLGYELERVPISREQQAIWGDIIMTRMNNYDIEVTADPKVAAISGEPAIVTNAHRWRVVGVNERDGSITAQRLNDNARAVLPAAYVKEHVVLGYVGTIHAAQGANAEVGLPIGDPDNITKSMLYPAMTRGTHMNRMYMTMKIAGEDEHHREHTGEEPQSRIAEPIEAQQLFMKMLKRDDREQTALAQAEDALKGLAAGERHADHLDAFGGIHPYVAQLGHTRAEIFHALAVEENELKAQRERYEHSSRTAQQRMIELAAERDRVHERGTERNYDDRDEGREIS
jgi:conjugative relaxase-like TrwC/TraI family protein